MIDGAWVDISADVYNRAPVHITRGRADEASTVDPGKCTLTLNNRDGRYSPRNPRSPLYGKLGKNQPVRVSVAGSDTWLRLPGIASAAAPIVTTDLDVAIEASLDNWQSDGAIELVSQRGVSGDSWSLFLLDRDVYLSWSSNGSDSTTLGSEVKVPFRASERGAVRVLLDTNNGAGGSSVAFYYGPSVDGPWERLGDPVETTPPSALYASSSPITVGGLPDASWTLAQGRVHAVRVRDGAAGALVADADFSAQTNGATGFTDSAGRVWTIPGGVSNLSTRFEGEVGSWPLEWDPSGADIWASITAAGISRRLGQGTKAIVSALRRRIESSSPVAYWPMEDDTGSTHAFTPLPGTRAADTVGFEYGNADAPGGSAPLPTVGDSAYFNALVPTYTDTGEWHAEWVYKLDSMPSTKRAVLRFRASGYVTRYVLYFGEDKIWLEGYASSPNEGQHVEDLVFSTSWGATEAVGTWNRMRLSAVKNVNGTVTMSVFWVVIGGGSHIGTYTYAGSQGRILRAYSNFPQDFSGMGMGHFGVFSANPDYAYNWADHGYTGETADARMLRVAAEADVPLVLDAPEGMPEMGAQRPDTLMGTLESCAGVDGGVVSETLHGRGLQYRSRTTVYDQVPTMDITYGQVAPPLRPVDDDQQMRNDVTATRTGGSAYRYQRLDGPLSVQDPPEGVGRYDSEIQVNAHTDEQLHGVAEWAVHLGTWEGDRYPALRINLAQSPELASAVCATDVLDRIRISGAPEWLPPEQIDLLVQGYEETLSLEGWEIEYNCTPFGPWRVGHTGGIDLVEDFTEEPFSVDITYGGSAPWYRVNDYNAHSGHFCLRSGAISLGQRSDATVTVPDGAEFMTVWYRTDSDISGTGSVGDLLTIYADGKPVRVAGGITEWTRLELDVRQISAILFRYEKDSAASAGEDAAFIDSLTFTFPAEDSDQARADTDGSVIVADISKTDTSLLVHVEEGPLWVLGDELVPLNINTDFEGTTSPWAASGGTLALTASNVFKGQYSALFTPSGTAAYPGIVSEPMPVVAGRLHTLYGRIQCAVTVTVDAVVKWYNASGGLVTTTVLPYTHVGPGVWRILELRMTPPAGAETATFGVNIQGTPAASAVLRADEMRFSASVDSPELPFQVQSGGEVMTVTDIQPYAYDTFTRTVSGGWGTADTGQIWTPAGLQPGDTLNTYGVSAFMSLATPPNTFRFQQLLGDLGDCEVACTISPSGLAVGDAMLPGVFVRRSASGYYWVSLGLMTDGSVLLVLISNGTQITYTTTGLRYTAETGIRMRVRVTGHTVRARAWLAVRQEPGTWDMTRTLTTNLSAVGAVGVAFSANPANTNAPREVSFDDFRVESPQRFTVIRGVNGLSLPHAAGSDIRLATPARAAW
ncbi:hypothetical protein ACQEU8_02460 [Streptomyces sp. CA-250714]|uniref:hypothetical protein n=1 Tax=Streptomyces sp. CA-250714 TaxID=3240060 RepID=UPI003D8F0677